MGARPAAALGARHRRIFRTARAAAGSIASDIAGTRREGTAAAAASARERGKNMAGTVAGSTRTARKRGAMGNTAANVAGATTIVIVEAATDRAQGSKRAAPRLFTNYFYIISDVK